MTDLLLLWIIQLAPLAAFFLIQLLPKTSKKIAPGVAVGFAFSAALASLMLLGAHGHGENLPLEFTRPWLQVAATRLWTGARVDHYTLVVGFLVDRLNLLMIVLVTTISFFIQLFSVYYMSEDPDRPRYFGFLSFFAFSMTGLVLSNNLLQTFLFWELVGLTSYLLIGFWYEKPSAATAARKAFVINRLADMGFYLGVIVLFILLGSLNFTDLTREFLRQSLPPNTVTILGLLVLLGVMGKSAQFPFHNWLPDAMEGPTPVSALIHSATMVAAGVFLLARAFPFFSASEKTLLAVLTVGSLTAFVGAAIATVQRDIKKVLAYSTISQLGLMVMAIGSGSMTAGMFHLSTHAYFKSLLFLTAGVFIHEFHSNDLWEIGRGGGKKNALAMAALCVGVFSLCGIFPFSGFFSKDLILEGLREKSLLFYGVALFVNFLTVYYSFRMLFVIALSKITPRESHAHGQSPILALCRALPLVSLASLSVLAGGLGARLMRHTNIEILATTTALIASGALLAFFQFKNPEAAEQKLENEDNLVKRVLAKKFYVDDAYEFVVKQVGLKFASLLDWFDRNVINGLMVNQTSLDVMRLGRVISKLQNGLLQDYLSLAVGVGVVLIYWIAHKP